MFQHIINNTLQVYRDTDLLINSIPNCCSKGCSHCCYQNIQIVATEELTITDYLDKKVSPSTKEIIRNQLESWLRYFIKNSPQERRLTQEDIADFDKKIAHDNIPCFFLINNECSIYPVRPLACRTHIVRDNPDGCRLDKRRDSIPDTKKVRDLWMTPRIMNFSLPNHFNLLSYALVDYFNIKLPLQKLRLEVFYKKDR